MSSNVSYTLVRAPRGPVRALALLAVIMGAALALSSGASAAERRPGR